MLLLESINPTGMFSFSQCETLNLSGRVLVNLIGINEDKHGDSNGAGKSSLFNSICELLFRENPTKVSGDAVINNCWGRGFAARLTFCSWERTTYRITYCRKWGTPIYASDNDNRTEYTGTALYLDKLVNGVWVDSRGASMRETEAKVQEAVGLTYDQFLAVAYMSPRVGNVLLRGANKDRLDVLSGIVRLNEWDEILEKVRAQKRKLTGEIQQAESSKAYLEGELNQLVSRVNAGKVVDFASQLSQIELTLASDHKRMEDLNVRQKSLGDKMTALNASRDEAWAALQSSGVQGKINDIQQKIHLTSALKATVAFPLDTKLVSDVESAKLALGTSRGRLSAVKGENALATVEACPTCGAKITKASRDKMGKSISAAQDNVDACQANLTRLTLVLESAKTQQDIEVAKKHKEIDSEVDKLKVELSQANQEYTNAVNKYNEIGSAPKELQNQIAQVQSEAAAVFNHISQLNFQVESLKKQQADFQALVDLTAAKGKDVETAKAKWSDLVIEANHRDWLISNIPYIKLHKLSVALTDLSDLANQYLAKMGDTARINMFSFREKKKAGSELKVDSLKSEISVVITDGAKNIDPRLYSDGETARFSNALIRALHDLALKHGHGCNVVLLDEIFSYVDGNNSQRIADSFTNAPGMTTIITDNSGVVANLMSFQETWTIRKSEGLSTIEV